MTKRRALVLGFLFVIAARAEAATVYTITTDSSLPIAGGNRRVDSLSFSGTSDTFGAINFAQWNDGRFRRITSQGVVETFGWTDDIPRDVTTSGNLFAGNPDRADTAPEFPNDEATLFDVFGPTLGDPASQNLSYIIDGEDVGRTYGGSRNLIYELDLFYGDGLFIKPDGNSGTVELALLERGLNSAIRLFGILDAGTGFDDATLTDGLLIDFRGAPRLYDLNTLEIASAQPVGGVGVSLDQFAGLKLVGFRLQYDGFDNMNGPDLVGVGSVQAIPEPSTIALVAIGAPASIALARRRLRRRAE